MKQVFSGLFRASLLVGLAMSSSAARAAWTEASTRHFVIYSRDTPEDVRQLAAKLERFDQAFRHVSRLGDAALGPVDRLTVYVMRNTGEVQSLSGAGLAGFYSAKLEGSVAVVARDYPGYHNFAQVVLFHEYSHHVLLSNFSAVWPIWVSEGLAEFYGNAAIQEDGSVHIGLPPNERACALLGTQQTVTGSHIEKRVTKLPLERLLTVSGVDALDGAQLYARGWLLVHHLNFEPARKGQLTQYLQALERGVGSREAGTAAFGEIATLDRELDAYLRRNNFRYLKIPTSEIPAGTISLRTLAPGEQEVMPYRIGAKVSDDDGDVDPKGVQTAVSALRTIAARYPDDALVQVTLSQAELDAGNHAAAERAADRAIAIDPKLLEAYIRKGSAQMAAAKSTRSADPAMWSEVRKTFIAANRLDPDHPQPLTLFYKTFSASGQAPTANAVAGLYRARELAPQVRELHLLAGYQYLMDAQLEPARKALMRYAFRPHAQEARNDAAAVVEALNREGVAAALETFLARGLKSW